ncbi:hypothetical protein [Wolbachia endosymbiont of Diaphorina citri]|nr:hypothetical protein [Wolbachia endosymbiont of Diaphorina citri]
MGFNEERENLLVSFLKKYQVTGLKTLIKEMKKERRSCIKQ